LSDFGSESCRSFDRSSRGDDVELLIGRPDLETSLGLFGVLLFTFPLQLVSGI
jgi:hypothetical protein